MAKVEGSDPVALPPSCKVCWGYMPKINKYVDVNVFKYGSKFPSRFPWTAKKEIFEQLLEYIELVSVMKQKTHHFMDDLKHFSDILEYRYVNKNYSVSLAREEHIYIINMLMYLTVYFDNDENMVKMLSTLNEKHLMPEVKKMYANYYYRPCKGCEACAQGTIYSKEACKAAMHKQK